MDMNVDPDGLENSNTNHVNNANNNARSMHNNNNTSNNSHSKTSSKPPNKYYTNNSNNYQNYYYAKHLYSKNNGSNNNASSHSHSNSHSRSHSHSHTHPSHPLHKRRHRSNKHNSHNTHNTNSNGHHHQSHQSHQSPPTTNTTTTATTFIYKSHSNNNNNNNNNNNKHSKVSKHQNRHNNTKNNSNNSNNTDVLSDSEIMDLSKEKHKNGKIINDNTVNQMTLSPLQIKEKREENKHKKGQEDDIYQHDDDDDEEDNDSDESDEFETNEASPIKVLAFDLDKTMVRTISLHTNQQPQPEQHPNGYFMFFDDDTKEYHHVYKRPFLKNLFDFLYCEIVMKQKCKMMLCTHGTQKYAQTILEKCGADKLFPLMLPRRDWCRRKFEDDYKPRRFKTISKMAQSANEVVEDVIMIDDDPGVYCVADRCNGSLVHIKPFDDPYEQRNDNELNKLIKFLAAIIKYGKNYYLKIFANAIRYTGLVKTFMNPTEMAQHSLFRASVIKKLMYDFHGHPLLIMNKEERLGTVFLFDRYCCQTNIDWNLYEFYVILLFACLFIARQYLYTDSKRPKQFRRDPYSAEIWQQHVIIYEKIVKKYKTMNGITVYNPQPSSSHRDHDRNHNHNHHSHHHHHHHHHRDKQRHHKSKNKQAKTQITLDDNQLITSYTQQHQVNNEQQQQLQIINTANTNSYPSQSHHRRKRKHKNREKQIYFSELHNITKQICESIGYPKLLHGLYHRPSNGYDSSLFVKYEDYVESLFHHIEKTQIQNIQNIANNPFIKYE